MSIAAKLASEGCSEAAALKNTLQLVVRSLGLVGQPVDAHPDLLVAALTSLPEVMRAPTRDCRHVSIAP